jgi:two-component system, OmpR family, response regulator RegX3
MTEARPHIPRVRPDPAMEGVPRMTETVLLVEDEHNVGTMVRSYLAHHGYRVVWVRTAEEGWVELSRHAIDLILLDIRLPGMDGFELCRRVRERSSVSIIMLTARDEEADRVLGLELGADDYVPKPFSPRELVARMRAVQRRVRPAVHQEPLACGPVRMDPLARTVMVSGEPVMFTAREFDLLYCLIENTGVVLTREQLLERVWSLDFMGGTRTVDQHVAQVRAKLGLPDLIETIRGVGYKAVRS